MLRMLRRAARLLLAGALGVALSPAAYLAAQDVPRSPASVQITTSQMRLEAMKVEMALLADYATYNLPLSVRVESDCLSLHGEVNDDHTRSHALRVARQACYLPVKDAMQGPTPRAPIQPVHLDAMRRTVADVLERSLGDRLSELDVRISPDGQVTLAGQVATVEDKVAASKALRGLPGCHSVVNCLTVQTHRQAGHTLTLVTRDGWHVVHGAVAAEPAAPMAKKPPTPDSDVDPGLSSPRIRATTHAPVSLPAPPSGNLPSVLPPARDVYVRLKSANQVAPITYVAPTSIAPTPTTVHVTSAPQPAPVQAPLTYVPPASGYAMAAPSPAPAQAPITALVLLPYSGNGSVGAIQVAAAPAPKPSVTMLGRMRSLFASSEQAAPAAVPVQLAPVAGQGQAGPVMAMPLTARSAAVNHSTRGAPAPAAVQPTQATAPAEPPPPPAPKPLPAFASGPSEKEWPPAHNVGNAREANRPRPMLTNSPAIRLAAHPELAAQVTTQATPAPAPPPAPKPAPPPAPKPAPKPAAPPVVLEQKPASAPTRLPSLIQTLTKVVSPVRSNVEPGVSSVRPVSHEPPRAGSPVRQTAMTTPMDSPAHAYKVVKAACGKLARSVQIETTADGKPVVHIHAMPSSEQELIGRLMAVPEIAASNLRLHIHLPN